MTGSLGRVTALASAPEDLEAKPRQRRARAAIIAGAALATIGALCGWAIYLELNGLIGRAALVYALLFAFLPVAPLVAVFLWLDRARPEPPRLLLVALLWGALGAAYISLELNGWLARQLGDQYGVTARSAVFVAPWVEETMKAAVVFALVWWRRHDFNAVIAGAVYGGLAGIGFAFTENIVYYGQLFQRVKDFDGDQAVALRAVEHLFAWRGVAAPFVHPMFTMLTGVGIGLAVRHRHVGARILAPVAGFCAAVLVHMGYNAAATFAPGAAMRVVYAALLVPVLAALVAALLFVRQHEFRVLAARLGDYTAFGWLPATHVFYIATFKGRRLARRHVEALSPADRDALRRFQRVGGELGMLRDRLVRGVAGPDELPREEELIRQLRALRDRVTLPSTAADSEPCLTRASSSW